MVERVRRLSSPPGSLTVVELLIAIVAVGILLAIAVPAYFGLRERAWDDEAKANLESAVPVVAEYAKTAAGYSGMTLTALRRIDPAIELDSDPLVTETTYCIESSVHGQTWRIIGPASTTPVAGTCPGRS